MTKELEQALNKLKQNEQYKEQIDAAFQAVEHDEASKQAFEADLEHIIHEEDIDLNNEILNRVGRENESAEKAVTDAGIPQEDSFSSLDDMLSSRFSAENAQDKFHVQSDNGHVEFTYDEWMELCDQVGITPEDLQKNENGTFTKKEQEVFDLKQSVLEDMLNVRLTEEEQKAYNDQIKTARTNGLDDNNKEKIQDSYADLGNLYDAKTAEDARAKITATIEKANEQPNPDWDKVAKDCQDIQKNAALKDKIAGIDERSKMQKLQKELSQSKLGVAKGAFGLAKGGAAVVMDAQENPEQAFLQMLNAPTDVLRMAQAISQYKQKHSEIDKMKLEAANPSKNSLTISKESQVQNAEKEVENYLSQIRSASKTSGKDLPLQEFNLPDGKHTLEVKNEFLKEGSNVKTTNMYLDGIKMEPKQMAGKMMEPVKDQLKQQAVKPTMQVETMMKSTKTAQEAVKTAQKAAKVAQKTAKTAAKASAKSIPVGGWIYAAVDAVKEVATKYIQKVGALGRGALDEKNKLDGDKGAR